MSELQTTHRTSVTEDMIDHLGHMNVRWYGVAARAGSDAVVARLGDADVEVRAVDLYTRHFREQLLGADLEVRSLVLSRDGGALRLYHELRNADTEELAASFVHRLEAGADAGAVSTWLPAGEEPDGEIPEHGRPRSIALDTRPLDAAPPLDDVRRDELLAMRRPRTIEADECLADGSYDPAAAPFLLWGGEPLEGATGPTLHPGPDGQLVGWATMENRMVINRLPERGDRIQSFGAVVEIRDKTTHRVMWGFDGERGDLLVAFEVVDVALDTVSRRAVPIPAELRGHAEARFRPDLLPR